MLKFRIKLTMIAIMISWLTGERHYISRKHIYKTLHEFCLSMSDCTDDYLKI